MVLRRWIALLAAVVTALATTSSARAQRLTREDMAGSTHVAVTSVIPWDEYVAALQPNFDLTEKEALGEVDKVRRSIESVSVNALANRFDLAPPTSGASSTSSQSTTSTQSSSITDGVPTESSSESTTSSQSSSATEGSGDVSTTPTGTAIASQATTPTLAEEPPEIGGLDPMLKFQAATALYQEVKLLNKYVESAVKRTGFRPYVVRTQVTVAPRTRNVPYDVYANISFFSNLTHDVLAGCYSNPGKDGCEKYKHQVDEFKAIMEKVKSGAESKENKEVVGERIEDLKKNDPRLSRVALVEDPVVVPLLVTDSLESTLHNQVTDRIRQFAFGLSFLIQGFGGKNEFQRYKRELERIIGRDFNSLMTVSRLADNTYRVRLGAVQQIETDYAAIPRNHYITFLLLAPCDTRTISVTASSRWIHATNGRALRSFSLKHLAKDFDRIAQDFVAAGEISMKNRKEFVDVLKTAQTLVLTNDYRGFRRALFLSPAIENPLTFPYGVVWNKVASLMTYFGLVTTSFELPAAKRPAFETGDVLVFDDGTKSTVVIRGTGFVAGRVDARLKVRRKASARGMFPIPSESVTVKSSGTEASIKFPSLQALDAKKAIFDTSGMNLAVVCRGCSRNYCEQIKDVDATANPTAQYLEKPKKESPPKKKEPGFVLETTAKSVTADRAGNGVIQLALTMKAVEPAPGRKSGDEDLLCKKVRLKFKGGNVKEMVPNPKDMASAHPSQYEFVKSGRIVFDLSSLNPENSLTFSATCEEGKGKDDKADPVELTVPVVTALPSAVLPVSVTQSE